MAPKLKFSKSEIVEAALSLAREDGMEAVTARALGERLGSSSKPIFTLFSGMEELQQEIVRAARVVYRGYVQQGLKETPAFKGVGMQYIRFAMQEPKLFQLLFMSEQSDEKSFDGILPYIDESYEEILQSVVDGCALPEDTAEALYRDTWLYTHGIASLIATGVCDFSENEVSRMLTGVFRALLMAKKETDNL